MCGDLKTLQITSIVELDYGGNYLVWLAIVVYKDCHLIFKSRAGCKCYKRSK